MYTSLSTNYFIQTRLTWFIQYRKQRTDVMFDKSVMYSNLSFNMLVNCSEFVNSKKSLFSRILNEIFENQQIKSSVCSCNFVWEIHLLWRIMGSIYVIQRSFSSVVFTIIMKQYILFFNQIMFSASCLCHKRTHTRA